MASGRIKGITIEIGADTTKLSTAIRDADKQINNATRSLKDINKLLKMDPKNTELLTQKQKALSDAIEGTKKKLEQEKQALEQLKNGPQTEETIRQQEALTREIADTEQQLKSLENEYRDFGSVAKQQAKAAAAEMQAVGDKIKKAGQSISNVGVGMTKYVTGPIVAAGVASVAAFKEVDKGLDEVAKKTGATGEELKKLQKEAKDLFKTMAITAEDAGNAVGEVNTRFGLIGDELETVSGEFVKFAKINDTDVTSSIDSVDAIMKKYGKDSSQVKEVLGLLTKACQKTGISMDTLQSSLQSNGASLQELGFGLEESVNLLAMMEQNGVEAGTAMTGLKKAVVKAAKEGKSADTALQEVVSSIKNAADETTALQIAQEAFGTRGAAEMVNAIRSERFTLDQLYTSLSLYGDVVDDTFAETQDATDQATIAMNNLKLAGAELAESGFAAFAPVLQDIVTKLQEFVDWFASLDDETKKNIVSIAGFLAIIGPCLIVIGNLITAVGTIVGTLGKLKLAFASLGPTITGSTAGASSAVATFMEGIGGTILSVLGSIAAAIVSFFAGAEIGKNIGAMIFPDDAELYEEYSGITGTLTMLKDFFVTLGEEICEAAKKYWNNLVEAAKLFGERTLEHLHNIKEGIISIWTSIKTSVLEIVDGIITGVKDFFNSLGDFFSDLGSRAWNWGKDIVTGIKDGIMGGISDIKNACVNIGNIIKSYLHFSEPDIGPLSNFNDWMPDMMKQMTAQINAGVPGVTSAMQNVAGSMAGAISPDYSGQLASINNGIGQLAAAGGATIEVPLYIGNQQFARAVAKANQSTNFRNGGR